MDSIPKVPKSLNNVDEEFGLKKYKKVFSSSPSSTETYVLQSESEESVADEDENSVLENFGLRRLANRMQDFVDEKNANTEIAEEGLFEISEPEFYELSSSDSEIELDTKFQPPTPTSSTDEWTGNVLLDFDARRNSSNGGGVLPHFGAFGSVRSVANSEHGVIDEVSKACTAPPNKQEGNRSRKTSFPTRFKSAIGGFSLFKNKNR